jgi:hypothetical protein
MGVTGSKSESAAKNFTALPPDGVRKLWTKTRKVCSLDQGVAAGFGLRPQDLALCLSSLKDFPGWSLSADEAFSTFDIDKVVPCYTSIRTLLNVIILF